jgi:2-(1,2-epoxy-1,2-dihydrophenyl)acetyl-CoA isomerase
MSDYDTVLYSTDGAVATITLDRPDALNSFNAELRAELAASLQRAGADTSIRAVVLTGAGRAFCAGADLRDGFADDIGKQLREDYKPCFDAIIDMPKPVISAVVGSAAGIGLSLAMVCDLSVMAEDAFLLAPFSNIGLLPDGGANWLLVKGMGYKQAYAAAIECRRIPANEAMSLGLVNRTVASDEVLHNAQAWAADLALRAPLSLAATKRTMRLAESAGYQEVFEAECHEQNNCRASNDAEEGVAAFLEKRKPEFTGT